MGNHVGQGNHILSHRPCHGIMLVVMHKSSFVTWLSIKFKPMKGQLIQVDYCYSSFQD